MSPKLITTINIDNISTFTSFSLTVTRQSTADYIRDYIISNGKLPVIVSIVELSSEDEANQLADILINRK